MQSLVLFLVATLGAQLTKCADDGLQIQVTRSVKCDRKSKNGDDISVNYNGTLTDGTPFDSTYQQGSVRPFSFTIGNQDVIKGWELGLLDMCIGDRRTLTLSPEYGYGSRGVGPIPPNSTLIFGTELMGIAGVPKPT